MGKAFNQSMGGEVEREIIYNPDRFHFSRTHNVEWPGCYFTWFPCLVKWKQEKVDLIMKIRLVGLSYYNFKIFGFKPFKGIQIGFK